MASGGGNDEFRGSVPALIEGVKEHSCLYDSNHAQYKDDDARSFAWLQVSLVSGDSAVACEKKWRWLRKTFTEKRGLQRRNDDVGRERTSIWPYYEAMLFFNKYIPMRTLKPDRPPRPYSADDAVRLCSTGGQAADGAAAPDDQREHLDDSDADWHFCSSLLARLRQLDGATKDRVKAATLQLWNQTINN